MLHARRLEALLNGAPVLIQALLQGKNLWLLIGADQGNQRGNVILRMDLERRNLFLCFSAVGIVEADLLEEGALVNVGLYIRDSVVRFFVNLLRSSSTVINPSRLVGDQPRKEDREQDQCAKETATAGQSRVRIRQLYSCRRRRFSAMPLTAFSPSEESMPVFAENRPRTQSSRLSKLRRENDRRWIFRTAVSLKHTRTGTKRPALFVPSNLPMCHQRRLGAEDAVKAFAILQKDQHPKHAAK